MGTILAMREPGRETRRRKGTARLRRRPGRGFIVVRAAPGAVDSSRPARSSRPRAARGTRPTARRSAHALQRRPPPRNRRLPTGAWWKELTRYQWFVFVVASLGWLFDTMDQQLFNLARVSAVRSLLHTRPATPPRPGLIDQIRGLHDPIFMIGWATGGIIFGILGDKIGRVKTMMLTILGYSAFTGLSALSTGVWDFALYRFLTGLGVGGQFAVGVSLVAEVMSDRVRPMALGWLQALSAIGNMMAAGISMVLGKSSRRRGRSAVPGGRCSWSAWSPPAGHPDLPPAQRARAVEGRGARGRGEGDGKPQAGLARRAVRRPSMAAEHDRRDGPGVRGRGRALGHRLLQLRPGGRGLPQALPGAGACRPRRSAAS